MAIRETTSNSWPGRRDGHEARAEGDRGVPEAEPRGGRLRGGEGSDGGEGKQGRWGE